MVQEVRLRDGSVVRFPADESALDGGRRASARRAALHGGPPSGLRPSFISPMLRMSTSMPRTAHRHTDKGGQGLEEEEETKTKKKIEEEEETKTKKKIEEEAEDEEEKEEEEKEVKEEKEEKEDGLHVRRERKGGKRQRHGVLKCEMSRCS